MPRLQRLRQFQRQLAPGTPLREGLDSILQGRTGALVVLGHNPKVQQISSGGFRLDVDYSPQALRELAKMDGAVILSSDTSRIVAAGVQLLAPGDLPTAETGTRHRSADRAAQATGVPTVTVSASMSLISLFIDGNRHLVESTDRLASRANQALGTLGTFVHRLETMLQHFNSLEVGEQVTIRDLAQICYRYEMTRRLSAETEFRIDLLGAEARHVELQHADLIATIEGLSELLVQDYSYNVPDPADFDLTRLSNFSTEELLSPVLVAERLGFGRRPLETPLQTRGTRLLLQVGKLPPYLVSLLVENHSLHELLGSSVAMLTEIDGVGDARARAIRDGLLRISEYHA